MGRSSVIATMVAAATILLSCKGQTAFDRARDRAHAQVDAGPASAALNVAGLTGSNPLGMLSTLVEKLDEPGPFEDPKSSPSWEEDKPHEVVLSLSGPIVEMKSMTWLSPPAGLEVRVLATRLRELASDEHVAGAMIRFGEVSVSMATAEEVRRLLLEFAGETRSLRCYAEQASSLTYYIMSACSEISMPVNGSLFVAGVAAVPMHIRGLLDRFAVTPDFIAVGAYKGAAEPLTRPAPSPQTRETIGAILDTAHATMVADIAAGRAQLQPDQVRAALDVGLYTATTAQAAKLVDHIETYDSFRSRAPAWTKVEWKEHATPGISQLMRFLGLGFSRPVGPRVALVYAVGNIVDGSGEGLIGARSEIASGTLVPAIGALARDDAIKAIVLRVDSPGGSALASELIADALAAAAEKKPVVVSMASVAASGGYYISTGAKKIYAERNTLTGSIGVVGGKLVFGKTLERYGVQSYPIARGKHALLFSALQPWTPAEKQAVRSTMEEVYKVFIARVAAGRNKSEKDVQAVAQGRVWTGEAALKRGLVDEIGGLDVAMAEARKLADLSDDSTVEVYPPEPTLRDILVSFGGVDSGRVGASMPSAIRELASAGDALGAVDARVLESLISQVLLLRDAPVLTAAFLPYAVR